MILFFQKFPFESFPMKKQKRSDQFKSLLTDLSRAEWESVVRHVEAHQDFDVESRKMAADILASLENNIDQQELEVFKKVKLNKLRPVERYTLLRKMRSLILEALSLQVNLERPGIYGNAYRQRTNNARKWIQATQFIEKGKMKDAQKLLDDIQSKALKYEHFDQLAQSLETSLLLASPESTKKTLLHLENALSEARVRRNALEQATLVFMKVRSSQFQRINSPENSYEQGIKALQNIPNGTDIATIAYFQKVLESQIAQANGDLERWGQLSMDLMNMCSSVPALQSTERIFVYLNNLVSTYIAQHEFKQAVPAIEEAQKLVKRDSFAYFDLQIKEIQIQLYQKKFDEISNQMTTLLKSRYTEKLPFALSYYAYFLAASDFYRGETVNAAKEVLQLLDESLANEDTLHLMTALLGIQIGEALRESDPSKSIEVLDKAVSKLALLKETGTLNRRETNLLQVFSGMVEQDFNPKKGTWLKQLEKVRAAKDPNNWKPAKLENFPLDEWAQARADKRKLWMKIPTRDAEAVTA